MKKYIPLVFVEGHIPNITHLGYNSFSLNDDWCFQNEYCTLVPCTFTYLCNSSFLSVPAPVGISLRQPLLMCLTVRVSISFWTVSFKTGLPSCDTPFQLSASLPIFLAFSSSPGVGLLLLFPWPKNQSQICCKCMPVRMPHCDWICQPLHCMEKVFLYFTLLPRFCRSSLTLEWPVPLVNCHATTSPFSLRMK